MPSAHGHITPPMAIARHPAGVGGALREAVLYGPAVFRFSRVTECNAALCYQSNIFTGETQD